jgi:hypothetical protein
MIRDVHSQLELELVMSSRELIGVTQDCQNLVICIIEGNLSALVNAAYHTDQNRT